MTGPTHAVPVEAVRASVTVDGAVILAHLAADHAEFQPTATVELFEQGWIATIVYVRPGFPKRVHHAHVGLVWAPKESVMAVGGGRP